MADEITRAAELDEAEREVRAVARRWAAQEQALSAMPTALDAVLAEYDRRGAELERLRARVAELEARDLEIRERAARAEAKRRCSDEGHDDDGHGPWHYTEFGVACSCGCSVDADEMCTRPRTPEGIHATRAGALFEAADNVLAARRRGAVPDSYYDDMQACVDALIVDDDPEVSS